ncbi:P-loop containing nucleoside triphosphate hydrolase [Glarea lozoyensis ATCC 20868]|uniref:p-loop containing nucleoside triphosphate hydrolase n=1 Tax=Glarea lozoyensis (strain ATCC 20868 / MF5171) TaxID=1116229 RepID=S3DAV5_GLAL2|nr:P-loop containing nucleoside triphosphate hydrolase [Glarea lozoyensis ATCC 20868]EPE29116.1 P-loop containing nucleoside triphosphate hydrolase [Glarea lozoyensis ATCC 20868]
MENDVFTRRKLEEWFEKSPVTPSASFECSTPAYSSTIAAQSLGDDIERETSDIPVSNADGTLQETRTILGNGTVFIEGQLKEELPICEIDKLQDELRSRLFAADFSFQIDEDLLADEDNTPIYLGSLYKWSKSFLESLKVVEYSKATHQTKYYSVSARSSRFDVRLYFLIQDAPNVGQSSFLPQAEVMYLPNTALHGAWERLVFDDGHKSNLVWKITNMSEVAFSYASVVSDVRHESARIVDDICTTLAVLCKDEPCEFNCVLIDEVESLTMSRQRGCLNGESQDTLRATNALLTGLDRLKVYSNILFLCTSNMPELMDSAFLNRCSLQMVIEPPGMESRYAILRGELQRLIRINAINHQGQIPSLSDARQEDNAGTDGVGCRLLDIVKHIGKIVAVSPEGQENSARFLSQLPQEAIELYLRDQYCSLQMAFSFMERFLKIDHLRTPETRSISKADLVCSGCDKSRRREDPVYNTALKIAQSRDGTGKRQLEIYTAGDEAEVLEDLWNFLEGRRKKTRVITTAREITTPSLETHIQTDNLQEENDPENDNTILCHEENSTWDKAHHRALELRPELFLRHDDQLQNVSHIYVFTQEPPTLTDYSSKQIYSSAKLYPEKKSSDTTVRECS